MDLSVDNILIDEDSADMIAEAPTVQKSIKLEPDDYELLKYLISRD